MSKLTNLDDIKPGTKLPDFPIKGKPRDVTVKAISTNRLCFTLAWGSEGEWQYMGDTTLKARLFPDPEVAPEDRFGVDAITCPYCGYEDRDSSDHHAESSDVNCEGCGKEFTCYLEISVSYTCVVKKADAA